MRKSHNNQSNFIERTPRPRTGLTREDEVKLLAAAMEISEDFYFAVLLCLRLGLHVYDLMRIKFEDVDSELGELRLRTARGRVLRTYPLDEYLADLLFDRSVGQSPANCIFGRNPAAIVLSAQSSLPKAAAKIGLENVSWATLQRTAFARAVAILNLPHSDERRVLDYCCTSLRDRPIRRNVQPAQEKPAVVEKPELDTTPRPSWFRTAVRGVLLPFKKVGRHAA